MFLQNDMFIRIQSTNFSYRTIPENLKHCVRDALNRKKLLEIIVLGGINNGYAINASPCCNWIVMMHMKASHFVLHDFLQFVLFIDGMPMFSKYLYSFPFPYYIVFKDIYSFQRTLENLLRLLFKWNLLFSSPFFL